MGLKVAENSDLSKLIHNVCLGCPNYQDFSRVSGKQEPPSGLASQQLSRLPSDEHICLSPPWNEEDDGPVRVGSLSDFSVILFFYLDCCW